jgi:hypothetical protein
MATIIMVKNRPKPGGTMLPEDTCIGIWHTGKNAKVFWGRKLAGTIYIFKWTVTQGFCTCATA